MTVVPPPAELLEVLGNADRILLSSHANPDGDAIGSELAMARILRKRGKTVTIWNKDSTPTIYAQLPGASEIQVGDHPPEGFPEAFDLAIPIECPTVERSGLEHHLELLPLVDIDHHLGNSMYGLAQWVDTDAPSAGEMLFRLAEALDVELDAETATLLYLTIVTDTGGFRFSNATAQAFASAARLVELGASPEQVSVWVYESLPLGTLKLLTEMLGSIELHAQGRIATVDLTPEMFEAAGASKDDSEGLIDYPRSIAGVEAVALFRTLPGGDVKVSLRSRGETDVAAVANRHEGGGHRNAAGCLLTENTPGARTDLVKELLAALELADGSRHGA